LISQSNSLFRSDKKRIDRELENVGQLPISADEASG